MIKIVFIDMSRTLVKGSGLLSAYKEEVIKDSVKRVEEIDAQNNQSPK